LHRGIDSGNKSVCCNRAWVFWHH